MVFSSRLESKRHDRKTNNGIAGRRDGKKLF